MKYLLLFLLLMPRALATMNYNKLILSSTNPVGTVTSAIMDVTDYSQYSAHVVITGATTCTSEIDVSNDYVNKTMTQLTGSVIAASSSGVMYNISGAYKYAQIKLTGCAGAGTLKVYFTAKEI